MHYLVLLVKFIRYYSSLSFNQVKGFRQTHYYPFGLTMTGISSKAAGSLSNKYKFTSKEEQSKEFSDGSGLEWTDFGARMYDNQIGRWHVLDAMSDKYEGISPYSYVLNDPINAIDPDGNLIIFVGGFMPNQYLNSDNRKFLGPIPMENPLYKPYPGERTLSQDAPTYLGEPFKYGWGNEVIGNIGDVKKGIGGLFSQIYDDYNTRFISASSIPGSIAESRYKEGVTAANDLIKQLDEGTIALTDKETIKIIGHSQGAAFAAGMVSILAKHEKYSSRLEAVQYLSPHQPNGFKHDSKIPADQWSTEEDEVSSKNRGLGLIKGNSKFQRIDGVDKSHFHKRKSYPSGYSGHAANTWIYAAAAYFQSLGIKVTIIN